MKHIGFWIFFLLLGIQLQAQPELDVLFKKLESASGDKEKCEILNDISLFVVNSDPEQSRDYAKQALSLAEKINFTEGKGFAYYNLGNVNYYIDEYEEGLANLKTAESLFKECGSEKGLGYVFNTRGEIQTLEGEYGDALNSLFEALSKFEKIKDNVGLARVNNNIGLIHYYQKNYDEALKYFNQALVTADEPRVGDASLYIGRVYIEQNNYSEAEKYLSKALEIGKKNEDNYIISDSYYLLGRIDAFYGEHEKAYTHFTESIELKKSLEDEQGIALCSIHLGNLLLGQNKVEDAGHYFYDAIRLAQSIGVREELKDAYLGISNVYNYKKQYDSAYHYLNLHNEVQNELLSEEASKKLAQLEASLDAQRQEALFEADRQMQAYNKKVMIYAGLAVIAVLLVFAYLMFNRYRMKQKANEQLQKFNDEIVQQKHIIEEKNRDIMDSIKYAKRIQEAILPSNEIMAAYLKDFFVMYRPKDIVSGDFYWALPIEENGKKKLLFASVDCTGHGVPGAFVSIVGYNGLNRAVKEYKLHQPAAILDKLNELVEETFRQQGTGNIKDGMDISLCSVEYMPDGSMELIFAAANNPLWIFRNGTQWEEIKADKQPIGAYLDRKPFKQHVIQLSKGDSMYIFSDGYADQFGGNDVTTRAGGGKKYKYSKMRDFIIAMQQEPMPVQQQKLTEEILRWTGELEQVDDQCVIGLRV